MVATDMREGSEERWAEREAVGGKERRRGVDVFNLCNYLMYATTRCTEVQFNQNLCNYLMFDKSRTTIQSEN
jgi:hypothetical protein